MHGLPYRHEQFQAFYTFGEPKVSATSAKTARESLGGKHFSFECFYFCDETVEKKVEKLNRYNLRTSYAFCYILYLLFSRNPYGGNARSKPKDGATIKPFEVECQCKTICSRQKFKPSKSIFHSTAPHCKNCRVALGL